MQWQSRRGSPAVQRSRGILPNPHPTSASSSFWPEMAWVVPCTELSLTHPRPTLEDSAAPPIRPLACPDGCLSVRCREPICEGCVEEHACACAMIYGKRHDLQAASCGGSKYFRRPANKTCWHA
jgi:hypothetical protein